MVTPEFLVPDRKSGGFFQVTHLATHASPVPDALPSRVVSASGLHDKAAGMPTAMWVKVSLELFAGATTFVVFALAAAGWTGR